MLYIITGSRSSGKTEIMKKIYKECSSKYGYSMDKIIKDDFVIGYSIVNLNTQKSTVAMIEKIHYKKEFEIGSENRRFYFNEELFKEIEEEFDQNYQLYDNLFFDEIGKLELVRKTGYYNTLISLIKISNSKDVYLTLGSKNLELFKEFTKCNNVTFKKFKIVNVAAVLLASGNSKRFGKSNKLLAEIDGFSFFETMLRKTISSDVFSQIIVVSKYKEIKEICNKYWNITFVENQNSQKGISESIKLGVLEAESEKSDGYMFLPCDQVNIEIESLKKLAGKFKENSKCIIEPIFDGKSASPKIFSSDYKEELLKLNGDNGGRSIISKYPEKLVKVKIENDAEIFDVDTSDDYKRIEGK